MLIKHYDGNDNKKCVFSSYKDQAVLYSKDAYDGCLCSYNTTMKCYSMYNKMTSRLSYFVTCNGGLVPFGNNSGQLKVYLKK